MLHLIESHQRAPANSRAEILRKASSNLQGWAVVGVAATATYGDPTMVY